MRVFSFFLELDYAGFPPPCTVVNQLGTILHKAALQSMCLFFIQHGLMYEVVNTDYMLSK